MAQLGIDSLMLTEIQQILQRNYNIDMDIPTFQKMTAGNLFQMENFKATSSLRKPDEEKRGIPYHEFLAPMHTVVQFKYSDTRRNIFVLPPIEGHLERMVSLCKRLNANVYGLQCISSCGFLKMRDFSLHYEKIIRNIQSKGPYYLLGYGYGTNLCLDTAYILEEGNELVRLVYLNGFPDYCNLSKNEKYMDTSKSYRVTYGRMLRIFLSEFGSLNCEKVSYFFIHIK